MLPVSSVAKTLQPDAGLLSNGCPWATTRSCTRPTQAGALAVTERRRTSACAPCPTDLSAGTVSASLRSLPTFKSQRAARASIVTKVSKPLKANIGPAISNLTAAMATRAWTVAVSVGSLNSRHTLPGHCNRTAMLTVLPAMMELIEMEVGCLRLQLPSSKSLLSMVGKTDEVITTIWSRESDAVSCLAPHGTNGRFIRSRT